MIISLYTLPDEMPPAFASSYTPIDEVGSEAQKRHLARMMAIQMTREGEGPGVEYIKAEKQKQFVEKQSAARSSEVIDKEKSNDETKKVIDEGTTSSLVQTAQVLDFTQLFYPVFVTISFVVVFSGRVVFSGQLDRAIFGLHSYRIGPTKFGQNSMPDSIFWAGPFPQP